MSYTQMADLLPYTLPFVKTKVIELKSSSYGYGSKRNLKDKDFQSDCMVFLFEVALAGQYVGAFSDAHISAINTKDLEL